MPLRATYHRTESVTTGLAGGPYLTVLNFAAIGTLDASNLLAIVSDFWLGLVPRMVSGATVNIQPNVQTVSSETGLIISETVGNGLVRSGTNGAAAEWTAKQGIISWKTGVYQYGRQVQGRTFVPGVPDEQGEQVPLPAYQDALTNAAISLIADAESAGTPLVTVSRPVEARTNPARPARPGTAYDVTSGVGRAMWGVLRSRRD